MAQNPEPNKSAIIYVVNITNNHLCVVKVSILEGDFQDKISIELILR